MECKKGHKVIQGEEINKNKPEIKIPAGNYLEVIFPESHSFISYYEKGKLKTEQISD